MSHILVISQYFNPEPFRINDMVKTWVEMGHKVTVVTGIPNYPEGKFYPGYGLFRRRRETYCGATVIRLPLLPRGKTPVGMVLNYFSFLWSGFFWSRFTRVKADCVFTFEVSPMTQAKIGVWFARRRKIPSYLYVQDLWPENVEIAAHIRSPLVLRPIGRMVDWIYRRTDRIFVTSPSFARAIEARGVSKEKITFWPQYAESFYAPGATPSQEVPQDGKLNVIFTGNIGSAQGLSLLPQTARLLREKGLPVRFVIVGDGREKPALLKTVANEKLEESFLFLGRRPAGEIPALLAAADAAFLSFAPEPLYEWTIPAKLQSYMACGRPILASAGGESRRIVEEAACGTVSPIGDAAALADAIAAFASLARETREEMGARAAAYAKAHFDKDTLMGEMEPYLAR